MCEVVNAGRENVNFNSHVTSCGLILKSSLHLPIFARMGYVVMASAMIKNDMARPTTLKHKDLNDE